MKLNYIKMISEINDLVETDFCYDMELNNLGDVKYSQKEAHEMQRIIGQVYSIAHCIDCNSCQKKYLTNK